MSPAIFIPIAEASGLIRPIGRWILHEACRQVAAWRRMGALDLHAGSPRRISTPDLHAAVNLSGRQLQDPVLVADVAAILAATELPADALVLEITESVVMEDANASLRELHALKRLGVRLGIDDLGTGYSSLSYLQRLPVDVLKIDKSFVHGVAEGAHDTALARTIMALGVTLGLCTIAEGIERREQAAQLRGLGCTIGQGSLFARPAVAAAIEPLILGIEAVGANGSECGSA